MNQILNISEGRKAAVSVRSVVVAARDQISSDLSGEAIVLNLSSGVYYGLDCVGAAVWQLIQQPTTVAQVRDALLQEYDVDPAKCERELLVFFDEMRNQKLVDVRADAAE